MKQAIVLILTLFVIGTSGCYVRTTARYNAYRIPEYRTRHHWGAPRYSSVHTTYWGRHRYGPRPHPNRGLQRY